MEAISHTGTVMGVLAKDGVVLGAEKKVNEKSFHSQRMG